MDARVLQIWSTDPDISPLTFALQGEIETGYTTEYETYTAKAASTYKTVYWSHGRTDDFDITLDLLAKAEAGWFITSSTQLLQICEQLLNMSLPIEAGSAETPGIVSIHVGNWLVRTGALKKVKFKFKPPWNISGEPMRAEVILTIIPTPIVAGKITASVNPVAPSWTFKKGY